MRIAGLIFILLALLLPAACHDRGGPIGATRQQSGGVREADDVARFVAGLPGRPQSPYKVLESDPAWQRHARAMSDLWSKFEKGPAHGMREFAGSELHSGVADSLPVWYPFSGADVLTMLTLFPGRSLYVMAALEPPGLVPVPKDLPAAALNAELPAIEGTLQSLLEKTFFVTREMDRQLRGQVVDGVTVPMLALLARSGYSILSHNYVQVDERGRITARTPGPFRSAFGLNRGIEFEIQSANGGAPARLIYLSLNLDDRHMRKNAAFPSYIASLGSTATLLKATSYMLQSPRFSRIRSLILERSAAIVQDDSGIPWRAFAPSSWQVQLYGEYSHPYGRNFQYRDQPDLRAAYESRRTAVKPLDFRMGYGALTVPSNLQVARKRS